LIAAIHKLANALMLGTVVFLLAKTGRANTYNFWTTNTAAVGTDLVALKVTFITSSNQIEVRITNLELNPIKETQAVASVDFLLAGFSGGQPQPTGIALKTNLATDPNLGYVVNFAASHDNSYTTAALTTAPANAWGISTTTRLLSGGTQITAINGGSPDYLIIGKSTNPTQYVGANNAVPGHSPYLGTDPNDYIAFTLTYAANSGITANTAISTSTMPMVDFGTAFLAGQELSLTDQPEPATVAMMLGGLGLILIGARRRREPKA
jgi:hypothetical protein